ncbi:hypothetical protein HJFPF1_00557 [Paramyrothecium foliicola]|nr:hypothetical protein HJFPF1_00557 [Paramyrothecium foliicola]
MPLAWNISRGQPALTSSPAATQLYVYPIKALRGIRLDEARIGPQGVQHDRTFMIYRRVEGGELQKVQLAAHPECSLFAQEIVGDTIHVRYLTPKQPLVAPRPEQQSTLEVPLSPDLTQLERADVNLYQSLVSAYLMGDKYDAWFSACFGFDAVLVYIGDAKRPVLGTFSPKELRAANAKGNGWLSSISGYLPLPGRQAPAADWLTFTDLAPFLVATEASLRNVSARFPDGTDVEMSKFRPNIVIDGETEWAEDYWDEVSVNGERALTMSKLCNRCVSLNVDYDTGRPADGEKGTVLKKLSAYRRVDQGWRYGPAFGRYAFLTDGASDTTIKVGDDVAVTNTLPERPVWDWPIHDKSVARFYQ